MKKVLLELHYLDDDDEYKACGKCAFSDTCVGDYDAMLRTLGDCEDSGYWVVVPTSGVEDE